MENVLATLVGWFSLHNIQIKLLNVKTNNKNQIQICSGTLLHGVPVTVRHCRLLEKEYARQLKETDFRFCKTSIRIKENTFQILDVEHAFILDSNQVLTRMPQRTIVMADEPSFTDDIR